MAKIRFKLNNKMIEIDENPNLRLLDVLRDKFGFTGVKEGCGEGECGACAILINNDVVNSCIVPLGNVNGKEIMTIEGFSLSEKFDVISSSFAEEGAVQCGICTQIGRASCRERVCLYV